ncbi:MAG: 3-oxoadipate enol-lactonase [Planctomycetota bacterium]
MNLITLGDVSLHYRIDGDPDGMPVVFANSLGTDFRLWDKILPLLPEGLRILRFDKRGHGLSSCPDGDYSMAALVADTAAIIEALKFDNCLFVGLSIGGMIAQGLAVERPELLRAMVISNTAARIGEAALWQERIDAARAGGIEALADNIMERWFSKQFHQHQATELQGWRNMLTRTPLQGYIGCSAAIAGSDLTAATASLTLPTLAIAGSEDGSTPPELVRATAALIAGSRFEEIVNAGHLPCVEQAEDYARILSEFIEANRHV